MRIAGCFQYLPIHILKGYSIDMLPALLAVSRSASQTSGCGLVAAVLTF